MAFLYNVIRLIWITVSAQILKCELERTQTTFIKAAVYSDSSKYNITLVLRVRRHREHVGIYVSHWASP